MRNGRLLATLLFVPFLLQCHDRSVTAPDIPDSLRAIAIRLHVDVASGTVSMVQSPSNPGVSFNLLAPEGVPARFSLLGSDGIAVQSSTATQTAMGANKVLVRFDLAITNLLTSVNLVTPKVPAPPPGVTGIVLFPFQTTVTGGGPAKVVPSADWDGAPFNFFNDVSCNGGADDCFRWEQYAALAAGATSAARTVGFEVDKSVPSFDVVMLLAADLQNVPPAPPALALSASTEQFDRLAGQTFATIQVTNTGGGTLSGLTATVAYAQGQPTGWLGAVLSSTTAPSVLTLAANGGALNDGTYNATVDVASPGVSNSPQSVTVTFVVTGSAAAIYVSQSDPNALDDISCGLGPTGTGTGNHPCSTIARGLSRATQIGRSEVRVADGRYTESVTLVNGKNLLGGYAPDTWQRHVTTTNTVIDGVSSLPTTNHDVTVSATAITSPTVFEGFVVRGSPNNKIAGNSYAIYVSNSSANLAIRHNVIYGGSGGPGTSGSAGSGGVQFADGSGRDANPAGYDALIVSGSSPCTISRSYINGGSGFAGADNISGGNGGGTICPPSADLVQLSAHNGIAGQSAAGVGGGAAGSAGTGGLDFRLESGTACVVAASGSQIGGNGGNGGNGQSGAPVAGASQAMGMVINGQWVGASGAAGLNGFSGGGGGGGGAGGGASWQSTTETGSDRLGGVGGGGGAGGSGGIGGGAGTAGGSSFGIFIVGSAPTVTDNAIVRGNGGNGGAGGAGAAGGLGAEGGAGGLGSIFCTGSGGHGGRGGNGGAGSGGGGGAGGGSFGIFTSGAGTPSYCSGGNNTISGGIAGQGGSGGSSPVNPGGSGTSGLLATCTSQ